MRIACHANSRSITHPSSKIRLFLDTADTAQWKRWSQTGLPPTFYGVTTNPLILQRDGVPCQKHTLRTLTDTAASLGYHELQLQTWGTSVQDMVDNGLHLHSFGAAQRTDFRVVVKIPTTADGLRAAWQLADAHGVPVTLTGLYNSAQVLSAVACGAAYAAPYLGRMNDAGRQGMEEVLRMQAIVQDHHCRILVASLRTAGDLSALLASGCDTLTISPAVADGLLVDELTEEAAAAFQVAAQEGGADADADADVQQAPVAHV